jgi:hypothetical protein
MKILYFIMSCIETINYPNNTSTHYSLNNKVMPSKKAIVNEIHFLLCKSCFWSASYFNIGSVTNAKCPSCNNDDRLESMPISYDEVYKFDYDQKRGITLEFSKKL